jgi:hypothetical protein
MERRERQATLTALQKDLHPTGRSARIKELLKARGWSVSFTAPWLGDLVINWYEVPAGAHLSRRPHPILVATGKATLTMRGPATITVRLTARGRHLLEREKTVALTAKGRFAPVGRSALVVTKQFVVRR